MTPIAPAETKIRLLREMHQMLSDLTGKANIVEMRMVIMPMDAFIASLGGADESERTLSIEFS